MVQIAVVGATGLVGATILSILAERGCSRDHIIALASRRSAGLLLPYQGGHLTVVSADDFDFSQVDIAIFSAGGHVSTWAVPRALKAGCWVVDNTSVFRLAQEAILSVPKIHKPKQWGERRLFSVPNCSTIQMLAILSPLKQAFGLEEVWVSTYQSYSGAGYDALKALEERGACMVARIGDVQADGYCVEEYKMIQETHRLLGHKLPIWPTTVRVPTQIGHGLSLSIRLAEDATLDEIKSALLGLKINRCVDDDMPLEAAKGLDEVHLGRFRWHPKQRQLMLYSVSDNLRLGAATTAVDLALDVIQPHLRRAICV